MAVAKHEAELAFVEPHRVALLLHRLDFHLFSISSLSLEARSKMSLFLSSQNCANILQYKYCEKEICSHDYQMIIDYLSKMR